MVHYSNVNLINHESTNEEGEENFALFSLSYELEQDEHLLYVLPLRRLSHLNQNPLAWRLFDNHPREGIEQILRISTRS